MLGVGEGLLQLSMLCLQAQLEDHLPLVKTTKCLSFMANSMIINIHLCNKIFRSGLEICPCSFIYEFFCTIHITNLTHQKDL